MKDYRIQIQLTSNLYTPLQGDTLFGMLCWMILYREGEEVLTTFLEKSKEQPQLLVSSAFPKDELPMPVIYSQLQFDLDKHFKYGKKLKKQKFISREKFLEIRNNFDLKKLQNDLLSELKNADNKSIPHILSKADTSKSSESNNFLAHNSINRLTGMVAEDGGLFFSEIVASPSYNQEDKENSSLFDIYVNVMPEYESIVKEAFTTLSTYGFGKDSSTGGGQFTVDYQEEKELFANNDKYTHGITLSPVVPAKDDPIEIDYQLFTRYGKIGHGSEIGSNTDKGYFKTPILMLQTGAVVTNPLKDYVGCLLGDLHKDKRVKHSGYSKLLGFNYNSTVKI